MYSDIFCCTPRSESLMLCTRKLAWAPPDAAGMHAVLYSLYRPCAAALQRALPHWWGWTDLNHECVVVEPLE